MESNATTTTAAGAGGATIPVETLTAWVREMERALAPGSETGLWGEYLQRAHVYRTNPADRWQAEDSPHIETTEAAWWVGAYCAAEAAKAGRCDTYPVDPELLALLPTAPQEGDGTALDDLLGRRATDEERAAMVDGYQWEMEQIAQGVEAV